jgi:hypothetical protein
MLLAAVAFNLRKYMRFKPAKSVSTAMEKSGNRLFPAVVLPFSPETNKTRVERCFWDIRL